MLVAEDPNQLSIQILLAKDKLEEGRPPRFRRTPIFFTTRPRPAVPPVSVRITAIRDTDHPDAKVYITKVVESEPHPDSAEIFEFEVVAADGSVLGSYTGTLLRRAARPEYFTYRSVS